MLYRIRRLLPCVTDCMHSIRFCCQEIKLHCLSRAHPNDIAIAVWQRVHYDVVASLHAGTLLAQQTAARSIVVQTYTGLHTFRYFVTRGG